MTARNQRHLAVLLSGLCAAPAPGLELWLAPGTVKPGDPVLVTVLGLQSAPSGQAGTRPLRFYPVEGGFQAVTALPVEQPPGSYPVRIEEGPPAGNAGGPPEVREGGVPEPRAGPPRRVVEGAVEVVDPRFRIRELQVASKYVKPPARVRRWIAEDRRAFERALAQEPTGPLFKEDFGWPRPANVTAPFGDLRTYNGQKQSQHYGVDLDGRIGDPVWAANDGQVVLVRECYASGNTVILHHGAGLYTLYFHLSAFDVKEGEGVKRGAVIGKVGRTGRVTGPHLHWSVKVDGLYVDGETLLTLPFRDRR